MELDMYLMASMSVDNDKAKKIGEVFPEMGDDFLANRLDLEVAYWRKANQIHNWFVENVQDGKDDCGKYYVELDKLKELYQVVHKVSKHHHTAAALLPPKEGFFFGSTGIDEMYFDDIQYTADILEKIFKLLDANKWTHFYYHSSW